MVPIDSNFTVCADTLMLPGDLTSVTSCGDPANGTYVIDEVTACAVYTAPSMGGVRDTLCLVVCDDQGFKDTTTLIVTVPLLPDTIPEVVRMDSLLTTCLDTTSLPGDITGAIFCQQPANGEAVYDPITGCVDYQPNPLYTGFDTVCVVLCDSEDFKDTTLITIMVIPPIDTIEVVTPMDSTVITCLDTTYAAG